MKEYTEEQLNVLKEIKRLFENLDQHPYGLYVPYTNFQKRFTVSADSYYVDAIMLVNKCYELKQLLRDTDLYRGNELNSTVNDEVELLNNCNKKISKTRIQRYMSNATEHLKRDLRNVLDIIKECESTGII